MHLNKDLREFIGLLNTNGVEYVVVGAFAVAWHGYARFTADIDFLVKPANENAELLLKTLRDFGFGELDLTVADFSREGGVIQLGAKPNRIDLLTSIEGVSFAEAWGSRVKGEIGDVTIPFIGRSELIRNKEATGRPQDLSDVHALRRREPRP